MPVNSAPGQPLRDVLPHTMSEQRSGAFCQPAAAIQLSAIEMSEADLMGATATTGVEVLVRLLEWCCCAFTVGASCACVRNITIVVVEKKKCPMIIL